jgi:hypothetical protein
MFCRRGWISTMPAREPQSSSIRAEKPGARSSASYRPADDQISILHLVAVNHDGRPAILVNRFEGPTAETSVQAGLWASAQLGRRPV